MTVELSEKAKENLERIAESRKKDSKFVRLESGEPDREEFNQIKSEAESQYDKVEKGLKIVKDALEDRTTRDKMGENIYG